MRYIVGIVVLVLAVAQLTRPTPCPPQLNQAEAVEALERVADMIAQGIPASEIALYLEYEIGHHKHQLEVN